MVTIGHGHRRLTLSGHHHGPPEEQRPDSSGGDEDATEVEPEQGNVLSHIISQLRPGADLSRVVLPTFILEPRSMLERITNFMAHPETLLPMPEVEDPIERFVSVVKFYLSGWHIKSPGVKKPLNPILGEYYTCYWDYHDHTRGYYIAEQTSHHPPKSSYFYMAPEHNIRIDGTLKPRSKFLGNSAASLMEGIAILRFLNRGSTGRGEKYILTQPNMYARGILFGKMKYELGDHSVVSCPENNLIADIEFKTKGYFSGGYNIIGGTIRNEKTQEVLYEISGMWNGEMTIRNVTTGHQETLFDATNAKHTPPTVRPLEEQDERESQRLWLKVVTALKERNHDAATDEKTRIEDRQRAETAQRVEKGIEWKPRLFRPVRGGPGGSEEGEEKLDWILDATIDGPTAEAQTRQILAIIPILPKAVQQSFIDQASKDVGHTQPAKSSVKEEIPPPPSQPNTGAVARASNTVAPPTQPASGTGAISANGGDNGHLPQKPDNTTAAAAPKAVVGDEPQKEHILAAPVLLPPFANHSINRTGGGLKPAISSENLIDLDGPSGSVPASATIAATAAATTATTDAASASPNLHASIHNPEHERETGVYTALMSNSHSNLADILQQPLVPQQMQPPQPTSSVQSLQSPSQQQHQPPMPLPQQQPQQTSPLDMSSLGIALERKDTDTPSEEVFVDADDGLN